MQLLNWSVPIDGKHRELYKYSHPQISDALANSCGSIVAILATNAADHPIVVDYDSWMENQSKVVKSADKFVLSPLSDAPMDVDPVESNIEAQFEEHRGEKRRREETLGDYKVPEPRFSKIVKGVGNKKIEAVQGHGQ
ncbi:hypothetical protein B0H14DRAFT_2600657 [Mycena olivaceomarginata]|nr:hypothetical protein B0H14DRAFT_2600657 [Mycena olivaceomarginata]